MRHSGTGTHLAELVENAVKVDQNFALGNLGNVVHGFTSVVSHPSILVGETGKHRRYYLGQVARQFLE